MQANHYSGLRDRCYDYRPNPKLQSPENTSLPMHYDYFRWFRFYQQYRDRPMKCLLQEYQAYTMIDLKAKQLENRQRVFFRHELGKLYFHLYPEFLKSDLIRLDLLH